MTDRSRTMILNRRTNHIENFRDILIEKMGVTVEEALKAGIYKVNSSHQIGIATASEGGLPMSRYPVRVIISNGGQDDRRCNGEVDACISYWKVTNSANQNLAFQRKMFASDMAIANLYKYVPDLDNMLWDHWDALIAASALPNVRYSADFDPAQEKLRDDTYAIINLPNPTEAQKAAVYANVVAMIAASTTAVKIVALKIDDNAYIRGIPQGLRYAGTGQANADMIMIKEVALTLLVNRDRIKGRWADLPDGAVSLCAYAICSMFRYGLMEAFTHKEFVTVIVTPNQGSATQFTVSKTDGPVGYEFHETLRAGSVIDIKDVKLHDKVATVGSLMTWIAGLMHYLYNHTTGGSKVSGPMLTVCTMFNVLNAQSSAEEQELVTNALYESVHPVNKRAIANIHFPTSKVYSHGKMRGAYMYDRMELDAFAAIRKSPYPAGSHKAYVASQAFKKVVMAGLGPFIPFNDQLDVFVNSCKEILSQGARAHIGAMYYTGNPPISQSSSLDAFMPDLARYMQNFHAHDSLTGSPHLSAEIAAKSAATWTALLKDIKSKDVSGISSDKVKAFLSMTGVGGFGFDPDNQETWAGAAEKSKDALRLLNNIFD